MFFIHLEVWRIARFSIIKNVSGIVFYPKICSAKRGMKYNFPKTFMTVIIVHAFYSYILSLIPAEVFEKKGNKQKEAGDGLFKKVIEIVV